MEDLKKVRLDVEIDRGLSLSRWRELEKVAIKGFEERIGLGTDERDPSIVRVDYSILGDLGVGDSLFVPARYGMGQTRSAALGFARYRGWSFVTRKTYESNTRGVRIFRLG